MCGFAGVYGNLNKKFDDKKIFSSLVHRGPDSSGRFLSENCILYHSRLTIIGNSIHGNQPITSKNNLVTLVYNGEIYNWKNLRNTYFPTKVKLIKSDTELILNLFEKFGIVFVKKLQGIFSIAIYSKKDEKIFLVRDRFGVKPLYYHKNLKSIYFSTEIKSLIAMEVKKQLNYSVLKSYLNDSKLLSSKETFFEDIYSLEPATIYEISKNGKKKTKYWNLKVNKKINYNNNEINELISDSIKSNLVADTNVGAFLSSGVDSSIIVDEMLKIKKTNCYTFGFKDKAYDESSEANNFFNRNKNFVHKNLNIKHENILNELKKAIYFFETPLGGLGTLSAYSLSKKVREDKIKVLLSGEGADELFGGYKHIYFFWLKKLFLNKDIDQLNLQIKEYNSNQVDKLSIKKLNYFFLNKKKIFSPDATSLTSNNQYLTKEFLEYPVSEDSIFSKKTDYLTNEILSEIFVKKLPKLLHFQDRASMANSVESRVPFLDHTLWDKLFVTNPKYLFDKGFTKMILRNNFEKRFKVKPKVKKYVATPQREWIKYHLKNDILDLIINGKLVKENILNFKEWSKAYKIYIKSKELGNSFFVWKILNAELLLREFF